MIMVTGKDKKKAVDEYFNLKEDFYWLHRIDYKSRLLIKKKNFTY